MSHPLDGCFERVRHADTLLYAFKRGIETAPQIHVDPPGAQWIEAKVDLERNWLDLCSAIDFDLPLAYGITFGDANHNLHAALDNLAHELGRLNGGQGSRVRLRFPDPQPTQRVVPRLHAQVSVVHRPEGARTHRVAPALCAGTG